MGWPRPRLQRSATARSVVRGPPCSVFPGVTASSPRSTWREVGRPGREGPLTPGCNFDLSCELCNVRVRTTAQLHKHYATAHLIKELQERFADVASLKCGLCGHTFSKKYALAVHKGCKHGKVNDLLLERGCMELPCPTEGKRQEEIQRKLVLVKNESLVEEIDVEDRTMGMEDRPN